jgi:hypothetical protein
MAAGNTRFRVENGLDVIGNANVSGLLRVDGDFSVGGNLAFTLTTAGDLMPTNNTFSVGNTTNRWTIFALQGNFQNVDATDTTSLNVATIATSLIPTANNKAFGNTTRLWDMYGNNTSLITAAISSTLTVGNSTVGTANMFALNVGANVNVSTTQLNIGNATGNSVLTQSTLTVGNSSVGTVNAYALNIGTGNATFRTDLLTLDGTNNRIGLKTGLASLSASALATVTGNIEFTTVNTAIRLQTSNASMNASIGVFGNTTNTRVTFNTFDSGISGTTTGGFSFTGTNATATQSLLDFNSTLLQYKSGNVAHSGNFGIFNVSGTRLGP